MNAETRSFLKALGAKVRELRTAAEWSQFDLADAAGVDRAYISRIENGRQNISIGIAADLAAAFNMTIQELLDL